MLIPNHIAGENARFLYVLVCDRCVSLLGKVAIRDGCLGKFKLFDPYLPNSTSKLQFRKSDPKSCFKHSGSEVANGNLRSLYLVAGGKKLSNDHRSLNILYKH